jgi:hypothetical protein
VQDYVKVHRPGRPGMMGRQKLMRWTERVLAAPDLDQAVDTLRRMARTTPIPTPVPGRPFKPSLSWRRLIQRLARGLGDGEPLFTPIGVGNDKLPFHTWSTLPVFTCPGAGECVDWCYSLTSWRVAGPWCRQTQNTLLLRFDKGLVEQAVQAIPPDRVLRLYVDGDFDSVETLDFWMRTLLKRLDLSAYSYSKSWDIVWEWWHDIGRKWDAFPNYWLNLSSGGKAQKVSRQEMLGLPFVRGDYLSMPVDYHAKKGWDRYDDPAYHRAVREAGRTRLGLKVFSCPGQCGPCANGGHACGSPEFKGITIVNAIH